MYVCVCVCVRVFVCNVFNLIFSYFLHHLGMLAGRTYEVYVVKVFCVLGWGTMKWKLLQDGSQCKGLAV